MKLDLTEVNGVYILSIEGELHSHNAKVLSAGVQKLLKDGKKQLVLNLEKTTEIDSSIPLEILKAKNLAEELGGTLLMAVKSSEILTLMEKKAGTGWCFKSQSEAIAAFKSKIDQKKTSQTQPQTDTNDNDDEDEFAEAEDEDSESEDDEDEYTGDPDLEISASDGSKAVQERDAIIEDLRAKIQQIEVKQLNQLRSENEKLKKTNELLQEKLLSEIKEDGEPPDVSAYQDKIRLLETRLNETLQKLRSFEKET